MLDAFVLPSVKLYEDPCKDADLGLVHQEAKSVARPGHSTGVQKRGMRETRTEGKGSSIREWRDVAANDR